MRGTLSATLRLGTRERSCSLITPLEIGKQYASNMLKKIRLNKMSSGLVLYVVFLGNLACFGLRWQVKKNCARKY